MPAVPLTPTKDSSRSGASPSLQKTRSTTPNSERSGFDGESVPESDREEEDGASTPSSGKS